MKRDGLTSQSEAIKQELLEHEARRSCCRTTEFETLLTAYPLAGGNGAGEGLLRLPNVLLAKRLLTLDRSIGGHDLRLHLLPPARRATVKHRKVTYRLEVFENKRIDRSALLSRVRQAALRRQCCCFAMLRGLMFRGGYVSSRRKGFHLEIVLPPAWPDDTVREATLRWKLELRSGTRRGRVVFWLKGGDAVASFLGNLGATSGLLTIEDTIVSRSLRSDINRSLNCELANLKRSSRSARAELDAIEYLASTGSLKYLPPLLREVAALRIRYPAASLREIGAKLSPPLTKMAIHHRMRRIREAARHERKQGR